MCPFTIQKKRKEKEKEIQKKRNIKSRKIDKRKRKMIVSQVFHNTQSGKITNISLCPMSTSDIPCSIQAPMSISNLSST